MSHRVQPTLQNSMMNRAGREDRSIQRIYQIKRMEVLVQVIIVAWIKVQRKDAMIKTAKSPPDCWNPTNVWRETLS